MPPTEPSSQSRRETYETLAWVGALGVGTSLYVAEQYFEYWLCENDPAEQSLVELFIDHPIEMLVEKPVLMARNSVLSVILSGVLLATLCLRLWLFATAEYYRQCWTAALRGEQ